MHHLPRPSLRVLGMASAAVAALAVGLVPGVTAVSTHVTAQISAQATAQVNGQATGHRTGSAGQSAARSAPRTADPMVPNSPAVHSRVHPRNTTSQNWFGYAADSGTYTSVEASWVQPSVDCSRGDGSSVYWVGLDGWGSSTVEQTGTEADCSGGQPAYSAWWETYPANDITTYNDSVNAGDQFYAKVTSQGSNNYELVLTDQTQGWTEDNPVQGASGASNASAEVVGETPGYSDGSYANLPDFGTVTFTGSQVDGQPIGNTNAQGIDLVRNGDTLATTGGLSSGTDFTETWQANS